MIIIFGNQFVNVAHGLSPDMKRSDKFRFPNEAGQLQPANALQV
jgi:hypothetical protein